MTFVRVYDTKKKSIRMTTCDPIAGCHSGPRKEEEEHTVTETKQTLRYLVSRCGKNSSRESGKRMKNRQAVDADIISVQSSGVAYFEHLFTPNVVQVQLNLFLY